MSVSKRVGEALYLTYDGNFEGALIPASIAVDATARREYPNLQSTERCKTFLDANMALIARFTFYSGGLFGSGTRFGKFSHPNPKLKADARGTVAVSAVIYHVVRCSLVHEAALDPQIALGGMNMGIRNNIFNMPNFIVYGLLIAVVSSPFNAGESCPKYHTFSVGNVRIDLDQLWGRKDLCLKLHETYFPRPHRRSPKA